MEAEPLAVVPDTIVVGQAAREEGGSRRSADRLLAVGGEEGPAATGKPVDVRRLGQWITVTTKRRPQVVDGDKQHIRPLPGLSLHHLRSAEDRSDPHQTNHDEPHSTASFCISRFFFFLPPASAALAGS